MKMKRMLPVLLLAPALVSCGNGILDPDHFANVYVLQNTPVVLEAAGGARYSVLADTLDLTVRPAVRRTTIEYESDAGVEVFSFIEHYVPSFSSARIELNMICPPNALMLCTPPPHLWGLPDGSGLSLRSQMDPSTPLRYTKVANPWLQ